MNNAERYPCATCKYQGSNLIVTIFMDEGYQTCYRPNRRIDPVTGQPEWTSCGIERRFSCGYEGQYHSDRGAKALDADQAAC